MTRPDYNITLLAMFLMMTSPWPQDEHVEIVENELLSITYSAAPAESVENQGFDLHGSLSTLYSRWFTQWTVSMDGEIQALDAIFDADFASLVPYDYQGDCLKLWRLELRPNPDPPSP